MRRFILSLIVVSLAFPNVLMAKSYKFSGGPAGGTYQYYADAIAELAQKNGMEVKANASGGSIVNIRVVDSGNSDFGVAYSGDVFKARNGMLSRDKKSYVNVMAMGYFYSASAQLVVKADAGITSAKELARKSVGVGNFGSGAAATCELFFTSLGIWHTIDKKFLGYSKAAEAFKKGQIDAFWVFTGFPNASVEQAASQNAIALINAYNDAESVDMFKEHPYFLKRIIPANTYKGVSTDTVSFQDSALWITSSQTPAEDVYKLLGMVYSDEGLIHMLKAHPSAKEMSIQDGIKGIVTPLHPGAEKFWKEKGIVK